MLDSIDPFSASTSQITMFFDSTKLSVGTAFFWHHNYQHYIITNWHNVSGKNSLTGAHLSPTAAEPNRVDVRFHARNQPGGFKVLSYRLRDEDGKALWKIHPTLGRQIDAIALPIDFNVSVHMYAINEQSLHSLQIRIGQEAFIIGYPQGLSPNGLPIWKRASFATEPNIYHDARRYALLDSASRPGMSGSPVIIRSRGSFALENGDVGMMAGHMTRLVGIYSGRIGASDSMDTQLGMLWPISYVEDIVMKGILDTE